MHTTEQLKSAKEALRTARGNRSQAEFILAQSGWSNDSCRESALAAALNEYTAPGEPVVIEDTKLANPRTMTDLVF